MIKVPSQSNLIDKYSKLSLQDSVNLIEKGISGDVIGKIQKTLRTTRKFLIENMDFKQKSLDMHSKTTLNKHQTEKVLRIINVIAKAFEVFEDEAHSIKWLTEKHDLFNNQAPLSMCATGFL